MKKIAVLGYGVVGSGVVELFYRNQKKIEKNTGTELEIGYILDLREFPDDPYGDRVVHDIQVILDDPEVGYVAECMGGVNPSFAVVWKPARALPLPTSSWLLKKATFCCRWQRHIT